VVVEVALFNVLGQRVATLTDNRLPKGRGELATSVAGLPSGLYVVRLRAGDHVRTRRVVVVK
jgi:hypothetical protein